MSAETEGTRVVLCEGIHDCAFWGGLLRNLRCTRGASHPRGTQGTGFASPTGAFISLRNIGGPLTWTHLADELKAANTEPISDIVFVEDLDLLESPIDFRNKRKERKGQVLRAAQGLRLPDERSPDTCWDPKTLTAVLPLASQAPITTQVSLVLWGANARAVDGVPERLDGVPQKQTLERVVCLAMARAYPAAAASVAGWLSSRPEPPPLSEHLHKAHVASYMAGWYAGRDYQGVFTAVWQDARIAAELKMILQDTGAWDVAERVAR